MWKRNTDACGAMRDTTGLRTSRPTTQKDATATRRRNQDGKGGKRAKLKKL